MTNVIKNETFNDLFLEKFLSGELWNTLAELALYLGHGFKADIVVSGCNHGFKLWKKLLL